MRRYVDNAAHVNWQSLWSDSSCLANTHQTLRLFHSWVSRKWKFLEVEVYKHVSADIEQYQQSYYSPFGHTVSPTLDIFSVQTQNSPVTHLCAGMCWQGQACLSWVSWLAGCFGRLRLWKHPILHLTAQTCWTNCCKGSQLRRSMLFTSKFPILLYIHKNQRGSGVKILSTLCFYDTGVIRGLWWIEHVA